MSRISAEPVRILLAEDDDDDFLLTQEALQQSHVLNPVERVLDGVELMDCLRARGRFAGRRSRPALVLLDLNMPRKDGRQALREIKSDPALRQLPVVVLTTSRSEEDVVRSYELGVNSFISKPVTFPGLVSAMKVLGDYWFEIVELPR